MRAWGTHSFAGGELRSLEVLTPRLVALRGVSSRLGVIRPPLPAQASGRLRRARVTGIPATLGGGSSETPRRLTPQGRSRHTCGRRAAPPRGLPGHRPWHSRSS